MRTLIVFCALATLSSGCSGDDSSGNAGAGGAPGTGGTTVGGGAGSSSNGAGGQVDASPAGTGGSAGDNDASSGGGAGGSDAKISGDAARESDAARPTDGSDAADSSDGAAGATWTGTWASSPQGCGGTFSQRTMREIVHTSIGGTAARVRISNTFSGGPLQITDVHVAQRTMGSSIDPATDKALTFNGKADVTIAAGMYAVSDGADFVVKPLSDVAVSFFVVSNNGVTCHQSGFQTNYSVGGNMVSSATLAGAQTNGSYNFLSNLDVMSANAEGAVVTLGASITDGYNAPSDANRRWPNDLAVRLVNGNRAIGVLNQGISGDGVANALSRFDRDVLSQANVKWVIFSDNPINDLGNFNPPAQTEIDQMKMMIAKAHAKGVKFFCSTLTPFEGAGYWSAQKETGRTAINAFIRGASSGCDGIVDQDTATHDPANPTRFLPAFNSGDSLHPNTAGLQAIADSVTLTLFQ